MVPLAFALLGSKYRYVSVLEIAEELAFCGSMSDSVIFVKVRSLFAGRRFLIPETSPSMLAPRPASLRRSVTREEREVKPRKRSEEGWVGWVGAEEIIVMRVSWRTVFTYLIEVVSAPAASRAWVKPSRSARETSCSVVRYLIAVRWDD